MTNPFIIIKNWIRRKIALFLISEINQINGEKLYEFHIKELEKFKGGKV